MFFYLGLFLLASFTSFCIAYLKNDEMRKFLMLFCFCILFFPSACRFGIGTDYDAYLAIFNDVLIGKKNIHGELGYIFCNKFLQLFTRNPQSIIALMAFLTLFFLFKSCFSYKDFVILIPVFYVCCYASSYNIIRQVFVSVLGLYSFRLFCIGETKKAFLISVISVFFHSIGILFVIFLLLNLVIRLGRKISILLYLFLFCSFQYMDIIDYVFFIASKTIFKAYLSTGYVRQTMLGSGLGIAIYFFVAFLLLCGIKGKSRLACVARLGIIFYLIAIMLGNKIYIFLRFRELFVIYLVSGAIAVKRTNVNAQFYICPAIFLLVIVAFKSIAVGNNGVIPYQHIPLF